MGLIFFNGGLPALLCRLKAWPGELLAPASLLFADSAPCGPSSLLRCTAHSWQTPAPDPAPQSAPQPAATAQPAPSELLSSLEQPVVFFFFEGRGLIHSVACYGRYWHHGFFSNRVKSQYSRQNFRIRSRGGVAGTEAHRSTEQRQ